MQQTLSIDISLHTLAGAQVSTTGLHTAVWGVSRPCNNNHFWAVMPNLHKDPVLVVIGRAFLTVLRSTEPSSKKQQVLPSVWSSLFFLSVHHPSRWQQPFRKASPWPPSAGSIARWDGMKGSLIWVSSVVELITTGGFRSNLISGLI